MKKYIWILLLTAWHHSYAQSKNDSVFSSSILSSVPLFDAGQHRLTSLKSAGASGYTRLFIFLSPECPLCQNYTKVLNQLNIQYAGKIKIYGIIPGKTYKPSEIAAFAEKYKIGYPLLTDESFSLSHYLQATVTPEAILLGPENQLLYKGAIDNWYKALGKARIRVTENYLQDAIDHALRQEPSPIKRTTPVGCSINDF
ncbi:MAG TPA: redoxin domain-containing protein [Puia sp.]